MKRRSLRLGIGLTILSLGLALAACGGSEPEATSPAPPVEQPAQQVVEPTATLVPVPPTATLVPTLPAPVLATPVPTLASNTAETADQAPAVEVIELIDPADFGDNRNRLTGEIVDNPAVLQRRPIVVKISNAPPAFVRPQSGLNSADIVFEHITEGALTRFTMLVYSEAPETMGPIRSARLIDLELPAMYDAALAYSGASSGVSQKLYSSDFIPRILLNGEEGFYRTGADKPYEHTLYARPEGLWAALDAKGQNGPPTFGKSMIFTSVPPAGGTPANEVVIDYRYEKIQWTYDPETNLYYRSFGENTFDPHLDELTGEQVAVRNIVVPYANHVLDANICEEADAAGNCLGLSVEIQLWGSGFVTVFRDGQKYDGFWARNGRNDMLTFTDGAGNPLPLQIGNSWFSIMDPNYDPVITSE